MRPSVRISAEPVERVDREEEEAETPGPDLANYVTERALVDGEPLPGSPWSGFELDVAGECDVTLELREPADDEL